MPSIAAAFTATLTVHERPGFTSSTSADVAEVKPGGSCTVSVAVNAAAIDGLYLNTRLTVITNDPSHPKQEVRLVGIVEDAGQ